AELSTHPELVEIKLLRSCIPLRVDQMKGRPMTAIGYPPPYPSPPVPPTAWKPSVFPEEPITCPKKFMWDAALRVSPGRVPKSFITPPCVHRTACIGHPTKSKSQAGDRDMVADQPTTWPKSLTPFAELLKFESVPPPNVPKSAATPLRHEVAC